MLQGKKVFVILQVMPAQKKLNLCRGGNKPDNQFVECNVVYVHKHEIVYM